MNADQITKIPLFLLILLFHNSHAQQYQQADMNTLRSLSLEQLLAVNVMVGTRGSGQSTLKALVPIDVITADEIERTGYGELGKVLQRLLPSFNFPRTSIADGTDHVRPFTLRGMGADQVLVLINGKRRHPSALLHTNSAIGRGSSSVDINMIPAQAVERIEVLRDAAAAQYGSDAIAGIINIILKKQVENSVRLIAGQMQEGDGDVGQVGFSVGTTGEQGFVSLHGEIRHRGHTNRSGLDRRQQYFDGDPRNDQPASVTHKLGDPEADDVLLMLNAEYRNLYGNASFGRRHSEASGFFRRPQDSRTVRDIYPYGFLPHIAPTIHDVGLTIGAKNTTAGWDLDGSYTLGYNHMQFDVEQSLNASLGATSPTEFDSGSMRFDQHIFGLDGFKEVDTGLVRPLKIGVGAELRFENFHIGSGEPDSYRQGGVPVLDGPNVGTSASAGAQVFPGFLPSNARNADRYNASLYLDIEYGLTELWQAQTAVRYEHYSDFGSTLNGKLATAYALNPAWTLRGSASTGFRAPSLAQSHYTRTSTGLIGDRLFEIGTFSVDHPLARALGATDLKPEKSRHLSLGFSYQPSKQLVFSFDYFYTRVNDRIVLSGDIFQDEELYGPVAVNALQQFDVLVARFFNNAIDTETQGFDLKLKYEWNLPKGRLNLSGHYHLNDNNIKGVVRAPSVLGENGADVILDRFERVQGIESGQPDDIVILSALYEYQRWILNLRLQRFGQVMIVNNRNQPERDQKTSAKWLTDVDVSYQLSEHFNLVVGAHNIFDVYPDTVNGLEDDPFFGADKVLPYVFNSPFGYNGAFYYLRLGYRF